MHQTRRPSPISILLFAALLIASAGAVPHVPQVDDPLEAARERLRGLLDDVPGLSVAVGRAGEVLWSEGFGFADLERRRPVAAETGFRIYSLSKPITSIALLQLAEAGRLDLDAPVHEILPSLPSREVPATPRLLATHMAGIRHYADEAEAYDPGRCETVAEALPLFAADPLLHEPGDAVRYSTWGFVLLSAAIEASSGRGYLDYVRDRVFEPVGAAVRLDPGPSPRPRDGEVAIPYDRDEDGAWEPSRSDASCKWGGGGLVASAPDVARVFMGLLDGSLLSEAGRERYFAPVTAPSGETVKGLGMSVVTREGMKVSGAMGAGAGGRAQLGILHELDLVMVILANAPGRGVDTEAVMAEVLFPLLRSGALESPGR